MTVANDDEEWTYAVDEIGEDAENGGDDGETTNDRRRIEPESMNPENALFVVLGVLIAIGTIAYGLGII